MIWSVGKTFVANSVLDPARHLLPERERIVLDDRDWEVFLHALVHSPEPNAALRRAVAVHERLMGSSHNRFFGLREFYRRIHI